MKFSDDSIINAQYQYSRIDILGQCLFSKGKTLWNKIFEVTIERIKIAEGNSRKSLE